MAIFLKLNNKEIKRLSYPKLNYIPNYIHPIWDILGSQHVFKATYPKYIPNYSQIAYWNLGYNQINL